MIFRQHRNGVSPRNQSFHEKNGESILKIVGGLLAICFWPVLLKVAIGVIVGLFLWLIAIDLWDNI